MDRAVNPNMIILARESRSMTQSQLAQELGFRQGKVSKYESGLLQPSKEALDEWCRVLDYPQHFFFESGNIYPLGIHFYRKAKSIPQKALGAINAWINIDRMRIHKLLNSVEMAPNKLFTAEVDSYEYGSPEAVARAV